MLVLGRCLFPPMKPFARCIPSSVFRARSLLRCKDDQFKVYAVCPQCSTIYEPGICIITNTDGTKESKLCTRVEYPCHPWSSYRTECRTAIMKPVRSRTGNIFYHPIRSYCFLSILTSLSRIMPRIRAHLNSWAKTPSVNNGSSSRKMYDIYDGRVWELVKQMTSDNPDTLCLSLTLNVDWFQPYDHITESIGAMYIAINNLPRHMRFKQHNIIIVGLIPGPKEPENMNSILGPLVDELKQLSVGVQINGENIQAILSCTANDIPASRKLCGFAGHSSRLACNKCYKVFPTEKFGEKPDFSGYNCESWPPRSDSDVKKGGLQYLQAKTKSEKESIVRQHGCRYSVLQDLPYFSVVRNTIIDPMHNLYLGTAKHVFKTWVKNDLITAENFYKIQEMVDSSFTPRDIGRIPRKIRSGFSSFTADQWRIWTLIFSMICLQNVLPSPELECWRQYVIACALISSKSISEGSVTTAHDYIVRFCKLSSMLYGKEFCTVNMHLHCHLRDIILDYGPIHSFWLFSFERYNGILGNIPNNHRSITMQLMRKFTQYNHLAGLHDKLPPDLKDEISPYLRYANNTGAVGKTLNPVSITIALSSKIDGNPFDGSISWDKADYEKLCPPIKETVLTAHELQVLKQMYSCLYSSGHVQEINRIVVSANRAICGNLVFSTSAVSSSSAAMSLWGKSVSELKLYYGDVHSLFQSTVKITTEGSQHTKTHLICMVQWLKPHPISNAIGFPWKLFYQDYEPLSEVSFIPLSRIYSRCAKVVYTIPHQQHEGDKVVALSPVDFTCADFVCKYMIRS